MEFIPLMKPNISEEDIEETCRVLRSGMLIQGKEVEALEMNFKMYNNIQHAVAASNGTATLHLALLALGIGKNDEVIIPAFSYIATANVVELAGATPVFVDIDIDTFNIDTAKIEQAITKKTKAIIPVHEFGLAADMAPVIKIAKAHKLYIIEDAACALGATDNGQYTGTFGDAGSFSLHPRKAITSGEGGMLVTNNEMLAAKFRVLRNHGIEIVNGKMEFVEAGFNYRMTDFQAALVNSQFKRMNAGLQYKQQFAEIYFKEITSSLVKLPAVPAGKTHSWQTFHVVLDDAVNRDEIILKLKDAGVGTNYGAQCMPYMQYYQQKYKLNCSLLFPNALKAYKQGLALPLYEKLTGDDIKNISRIVNQIL
ncbi:MAG: DegT/DnrJ/EryC1/StrS family aminotransferase [Ferruginibacter sp.]